MREPKEPRMKGLINKQWWSALLLIFGGLLLYKVVDDPRGLLQAIGKLISMALSVQLTPLPPLRIWRRRSTSSWKPSKVS